MKTLITFNVSQTRLRQLVEDEKLNAEKWLTLPWCSAVIALGIAQGKTIEISLDFWKLTTTGGWLITGPWGNPSDEEKTAIEIIKKTNGLAEHLGSNCLTIWYL
jgi:hypothetical protein